MMLIENKYEIGDIVYLKTDPDQNERIVTAIQINSNGLVYLLAHNTSVDWHYDIEITPEKSFVLNNKNKDKNK